mgnify:CR=1 FL=1
MRKLLLGTTALAAAATLSANVAVADVSISGYYEWKYQSTSSNITANDGTTFGNDSEIALKFSNKTDSGLDLNFRYDIGAVTSSDQALLGDEASLSISGGFGKIVLGTDDDASDSYGIDEMDIVAEEPTSSHASASIGQSSSIGSSDAMKIAYHLPAMGGLTSGISFADSGEQGGSDKTGYGFKYAMDAAGASVTLGYRATSTEAATKDTDEYPLYTSSTAMKYGWMWQIPLQDRIGAGYVFDSDYIDAAQAQEETEKFLGHKIDVRKVINFEAGRHEKYWVDNCMAVGLAACFIEPLESTIIHLTVLQLQLLRQFASDLFDGTNDMFNEVITNTMDEILYFIYLHYITKRKDSSFWRNFKKDYPCPPAFKPVLQAIQNNNLKHYDIKSTNRIQPGFSVTSYLQIANGLGLFKKDINIKEYNQNYTHKEYTFHLSSEVIPLICFGMQMDGT